VSTFVWVEPEAEDELAAAVAWYDTQGPGLGDALVAEVDAVLASLRELPAPDVTVLMVRKPRARRILLSRFPYSVVFLRRGEEIHVVAIAHHKRKPGYWRRRPSRT
jgi:plasmid stabilization system protein ParE